MNSQQWNRLESAGRLDEKLRSSKDAVKATLQNQLSERRRHRLTERSGNSLFVTVRTDFKKKVTQYCSHVINLKWIRKTTHWWKALVSQKHFLETNIIIDEKYFYFTHCFWFLTSLFKLQLIKLLLTEQTIKDFALLLLLGGCLIWNTFNNLPIINYFDCVN